MYSNCSNLSRIICVVERKPFWVTINPTLKSAFVQVVRSGILSNTNTIVLFLKRVHVGVVSFIPGSKQPSASGFIDFTVIIFHGCSLLSWIVYCRAGVVVGRKGCTKVG